MKKIAILSIVLLVVAIATVSGTYAFFTATVTQRNPMASTTDQLEIIYTGDTTLNDVLHLATDKSEGHRRQVSISIAENSLAAKANIYIYVEQITSALATEGLVWEIYKVENGVETDKIEGSFIDCGNIGQTKRKCVSGDKLYMLTGIELTSTPQTFAIYLWLNGYKVGNEVVGATFKGYIGAETENISAILK